MASIIPVISLIWRESWLMVSMVSTTWLTTWPPCSAVVEAWLAKWRAWPALSAFWDTVVVSCSMLAAVCSMEAACCSVRVARSTLPEAISWLPLAMRVPPRRTSLTVWPSLCCISCMARNSWLISLSPRTWIGRDRSAWAMASRLSTARASGLITRLFNSR